jgi:H+-transporting ATPase
VIALVLAVGGIAMTALPAAVVAGVLGAAVVFALVQDAVKIPVFAHLRIT